MHAEYDREAVSEHDRLTVLSGRHPLRRHAEHPQHLPCQGGVGRCDDMRIGQASLRVDDEMDDYRPFYIVVLCGGGVLQIGHDPGAESYQAAAHEVGGLAVACRKDRLFRADGVAERDR